MEKGIARKFYLYIIIEQHLTVEAFLDTGADITLMSTELLEKVQERYKQTNSANSGTNGPRPSSICFNTQHVSTPRWERSA